MLLALALLALAACSGSNDTPPASGAPETSTGTTIVFNRLSGGELALFSVAPDGSNERQIRVLGDFVALSPDGSRFLSAVPAEDGRIAPELFDADGSNHTVLSIDDPTLQLGDMRGPPTAPGSSATGGTTPAPRARASMPSTRATGVTSSG